MKNIQFKVLLKKSFLFFLGGGCQLCEICLIKSLSLQDLCASAGASINARARALAPVHAPFPLSSGMQPVPTLLNPQWVSKPEKPLIFFSLRLLTRKRTPSFSLSPVSLFLSLSWDERTRGNVGPTPHSDQI